jgi:hypothetical protein
MSYAFVTRFQLALSRLSPSLSEHSGERCAFTLTAEIPYWARHYHAKDDEDALDAGHRIAARLNTSAEVYVIFKWKTKNRGVSRLRKNEEKTILASFSTPRGARRCCVRYPVGEPPKRG